MCSPTAAVAVASMVVQMRAQQQKADFTEDVAKYNARVSQNKAEVVRGKGVEEEKRQRLKTAQLISKQRAQLGASGIDLSSGSALQLQQDAQTLGEADALRIRSNFENEALALETGAGLTLSQGAFAKQAGKNKQAGTLLSGAAEVADTGVADKWFTPDSSANSNSALVS